MKKYCLYVFIFLFLFESSFSFAQADNDFQKKIAALSWVKGPTTVNISSNSTLKVPDGYVFLDIENTDKFLELNENIPTGQEVMIAPETLEWTAYFGFQGDGYVKDDEEIDPDALLSAYLKNEKLSNEERKKRGWGELHTVGWSVAPKYNKTVNRLEWATLSDTQTANFYTKVLGRRGHTSVQLVTDNKILSTARNDLNSVLDGYSFNQGEQYSSWVPGDKVAEYGLGAMVLGGAAAVATKKGLWTLLAGFFAAAWKLVVAAVVALIASIKSFFKKKSS
jgi:hypothetical protein